MNVDECGTAVAANVARISFIFLLDIVAAQDSSSNVYSFLDSGIQKCI